jgi:hypothetical protein
MQEEKTLDSQVETTQIQSEVSTPESDGKTETINNESQDSGQTAPLQEDVDYKTRWQSSSEEARKLFKEKQDLEKKMKDVEDSVTSFVTSDRQVLSRYLDSRGLPVEEKQKFLSAFDAQNSVPVEQQVEPKSTSRAPQSLDPYQQKVLDDAAGKLRTQVEKRQMATQRFLEDSSNKSLSKETLNAIWPLAFKLETEDGLDPDTAIVRARSIVSGQNEIEDQGYARGISDLLFNGVSSGVSGGSGGSQGHDRLPPEHEAFVKREIESEGLKGRAAEDFRKRYVERLALKRLI